MRFSLLGFLITLGLLIGGCNNSQEINLSSTEKLEQEKVLNDPNYINANEETKEAIRQKYKIQLRIVKMPDGTIVKDVPDNIGDSEVLQRYKNSLADKKNNQLPPEVMKQIQEEANKNAQEAIKEFEANLNKPLPKPPAINFPTDLPGIEREFHRVMACNEAAEKTTNNYQECTDKALTVKSFFDRKQESLCLSELYLKKYQTYCDGFSNNHFVKISTLYNKAFWADMPVPNEEKYQPIKKKIELEKEKARLDYIKYINDEEKIISNMKLAEELIKRGERLEREQTQKKLSEAQEERDRRMSKAIEDIKKGLELIKGSSSINPGMPKTEVIQFQGGPPITCTTLNNFTNCI